MTEIAANTFVPSDGVILSNFENLGLWTVEGGTLSRGSHLSLTGNKGGKLTVNSPGGLATMEQDVTALDIPELISLWAYIDNVNSITGFTIYTSSTTDWHKYLFKNVNYTDLEKGWNLIKIPIKEMQIENGEDISEPFKKIRFYVGARPDNQPSITFDEVAINVKTSPKVIISFDDCWRGVYLNAFPYMKSKGLKGTCWVIPSMLNDGGYHMDEAELKEVYGEGWSVGNHTYNHDDLTKLTRAQIKKTILDCRDWQLQNEYYRGIDHICYPFGAYNTKVINIVKNLEFFTGRTVRVLAQEIPVYNYYALRTNLHLLSSSTFAQAKEKIDGALATGATLFVVIHDVKDNPVSELEMSTALFKEIIDYLLEVKMDVMTIDQWYDA